MRTWRGAVVTLAFLTLGAAGFPCDSYAAPDAEFPCPPGLTYNSGQVLVGCRANIVSPGGTASVTIDWNAECPLSGQPPNLHFWYVVILLKHQDGSKQTSGTEQAPTGSESFGGRLDFAVPILPSKASSDTVNWEVIEHCNSGQQQIDSGTCVLCAGATSQDGPGELGTKHFEGKCSNMYDDKTKEKCGRGKGNCTIGWGHKIHDGKCAL